MVVVLVVAAGAAWESRALHLLGERAGVVVLKRCVDVDDLLAAASAGQAHVAVLGVDAPGLDVAALRATRIGIRSMVAEDELESLPDAVAAGEEPPDTAVRVSDAPAEEQVVPSLAGRVLAVWGPGGAPGRTTVAVGVAAELARRRVRTVLVDADPYGGSVAQQLGVLDEVSGLLSTARVAAGGMLAERFGSVQRGVGQHLTVVTGLPRADRWLEVRAGVVEHLLEVAREHGQVVVDTGFSLEQDPMPEVGSRPARNQMTHAALEVADDVLVVGSADPVGLSRLARGLVEVRDVLAGAPVHVVVNRMRSTLGWSEKDIVGMVEGFTRLASLHFLPEDRPAVDKALVSGNSVVEAAGDSPMARGLGAVVDALAPETAAAPSSARVRRPRRGRA